MAGGETAPQGKRAWVWALIVWVVASGCLAAAQSYTLWGPTWWWSSFYWPNFFAFLLPVIALAALIAAVGRWLAPGKAGEWVRKWVWIALAVRCLSVMIWPIVLREWGYRSAEELGGFLSTDAFNATNTAWTNSQQGFSAVSTFHPDNGDNTGGITFLAVVVFRLFSPDHQRPMLLGLLASAFSSLAVLFIYLIGESLFSVRVARAAGVVAALFPEAVLIGSSHLQQGYLATFLAVMIWGLVGIFVTRRDGPPGGSHYRLGWRSGLGFAVAGLLLSTFVSTQFGLLGLAVAVVLALWLSDPRRRLGQIVWIVSGIGVLVLVVLFFLGQADVVPYQFNLLLRQWRFLFGEAWLEYNRMRATGSGSDLFMQLLSQLPRSTALLVAGLWGLLQPMLPAAIGYRSPSPAGSGIAQILGILRGAGWYLLLPFLLYGFLASLRVLGRRRAETGFALLFWAIALISSYRALGDQWDNPRYRLFALAPMALTVGWAYWHWRESQSPWLARVQVPYWVAVAAMTAWYLGRYWLNVKLPAVLALGGILGVAAMAFLATLIATWPRRRRSIEPPVASP
jgi:4-amino-4-deoxy-L-arabinose transferase-like glycosyltransferase